MARLRTPLLLGTLVLPLAVGGFVAEKRASHQGSRLFDQVLMLVSDRFVDTVAVGDLYEKAARGLVSQLKDPYSELFSPKEIALFDRNSRGHYGGIGMSIEKQEEGVTVVKVFPHTPAEQAGVLEGDRIMVVDTVNTRTWSTAQVQDALLGTPGTKVTVKFARVGVGELIEHRFTRSEIRIPAVPYALMLEGNIAYVPLQTFNETAFEEMRASIDRLLKQGARSIILDLRLDPGGILEQGLAVPDYFLQTGQSLLTVKGRQGTTQSFSAHLKDHLPDVPLVVMVNGYSASASEIAAGALQDHDRALIVGTTSYGKGLVQSVYPLDGGWALKLTTAKWFTPNGRSIHKDRRPADPSSTAGATSTDSASKPDSLEKESVKKTRPAYRSDAGRLVYGGGGITPDVIVPEDTISTPEQEFAKSIAPKAGVWRSTLYTYALELKSGVSKDFAVKPEWRDELYRRLKTANVVQDRKLFDAATPLINRWLSRQIAQFAFGDSTVFRREIPEDHQILKAIELLKKAQTEKDLFAIASRSKSGGEK
ncbi:MAG: S41 family peptidase [Gemmatimonadota bacterium]|nr:S41 family peptidase [Gemmatimonadota bacterium]